MQHRAKLGSASSSSLSANLAVTTGWDQYQSRIACLNRSYFSGDYSFRGSKLSGFGKCQTESTEKVKIFLLAFLHHDFDV